MICPFCNKPFPEVRELITGPYCECADKGFAFGETTNSTTQAPQVSTPTTEQECERIARECAEACAKTLQDYDARKWKQSDPCVTDHILTAAARITALKVKATGASEALAATKPEYSEWDSPEESALVDAQYSAWKNNRDKAIAALRSLERGEG